MKIDPIILGHNQFIGVDHLSQDRARDRVQKFSNVQNVLDIINFFYDCGGTGMMLSTHPSSRTILEAIRSDNRLSNNLNLYPLIPYAQGYIRKANEVGIIGMLDDSLQQVSTTRKFKILIKGGLSYLKKDYIDTLSTLIDLELAPFTGMKMNGIFLHNVLTDLALSFNSQKIFEYYIDYINDNYGVSPAFGTMNFARLAERFDEWGISDSIIMTSFNKVGFQMNPSREECERCLSDYKVNVLAMSTLAAGYLKPQEAYEYLFSLPNIKSVVVGVSSKEHTKETIGMIKNYYLNL
jgi:hypothetical protein